MALKISFQYLASIQHKNCYRFLALVSFSEVLEYDLMGEASVRKLSRHLALVSSYR